MITQYDSIIPSTIPADAEAVAGYCGGRWPDFAQLVSMFPHARHKSIAISAVEDADVLDVENGDASPWEAPGWYKRQKTRGHLLPVVYADASTMPAVRAAMEAAGIRDYEWGEWVAWLGDTAIPAGALARQYTFTALGRNLDASVCLPAFWPAAPAPPAVNATHYDRFDGGSFRIGVLRLHERAVVQEYDRLRATQTNTSHPAGPRMRLYVLRAYLRLLAGRVYQVAHDQPRKNGRPSWNLDYRGYRYQQLTHRGQGQRLV